QACLVETDTESEPFEGPVKTETPESPYTVASPTSLPDSTQPTCHAKESEDSDTSGVRSTSSDSTAPLSLDHPRNHTSSTLVPFLCWTTYMVVRVPSAMSPGLSASIAEVAAMSDSAFRKRGGGGRGELDSNSESKDAKDEGPTVEDEGLAAEDEGSGMRVESLDLGGDEDVPKAPSTIPPPISSPMISITIPSPVTSPAAAEAEGFLTEDIGEFFTRSWAVRDEIFSQRYRLRSLEHEQEKVAVTFGAIWRPVLALESWAGQTDAHRAALWHAIGDTQIEN
nr:hypothetical protein [Tanacetum cinerariifolium]